MKNENKTKVQLVGELAELRQQMAEQQESEERLRSIFENANDAIFIHDMGKVFLEVNQTACERLGYSRKELLRMAPRDISVPIAEDQAEKETAFAERKHKRKNGTIFPVEISSRTVQYAGKSAVLSIARDITERKWVEDALQKAYDELEQRVGARTTELQEEIAERKRAEEMLQESEERFRLFAESTFEGIVVSEKGIFLEANDQFAEIFGYHPSEIAGMDVRDFVPPEMMELVQKHIASGYEQSYKSIGRRKNGTTFPIEVQGRMMPYKKRQVRTTAVRDLSERKQLEEQLRQSQKMEAIGQLTAGIAHNFNNRLMVILNNIETAMLRGRGDSEELRAAERSTLQAAEMVEQLMLFSRSERTVKSKPIQIREVLSNALEIGRKTFDRRIDLSEEIPRNLPLVSGDINQLEQVFLNLLLNARDAVEESNASSPSIHLGANIVSIEEEAPPVHLVLRQRDYIRIQTMDDGVGMDGETQQRIFEPFFTTKDVDQGTGLGLATAYAIIDEHQGWIECESQVGIGTTISVYLPVTAPEIVPSNIRQSQLIPRGTETILSRSFFRRDMRSIVPRHWEPRPCSKSRIA